MDRGIIFISRVFMQTLLVFCPIMTGWAAAADSGAGFSAPDPEQLTISDLRCPGAGPEYLEAYRTFLKSRVTDQGGHSYTSSIPVLRQASQDAHNAAVKLRCLLLLAWAYYLNGSAEEANASAMEGLTLAKQAAIPADKDIALLDNLRAFISSNSFVRPADLKKHLNINDDISALMEDLFYLEKSRVTWRQMAALRPGRVKALLEARITDEGKAWGISAADLEKIKPVLKKKYEKQPEVDFLELAADFENEYAKMLLDELEQSDRGIQLSLFLVDGHAGVLTQRLFFSGWCVALLDTPDDVASLSVTETFHEDGELPRTYGELIRSVEFTTSEVKLRLVRDMLTGDIRRFINGNEFRFAQA